MNQTVAPLVSNRIHLEEAVETWMSVFTVHVVTEANATI